MGQDIIKKGYKEDVYTPEKAQELKRCAKDPVYFVKNYVYIQNPTKGRMKFELYDFQIDLLKTYAEYNSSVNLLSRQLGKSVTFNCNISYNGKQEKIGKLLKLNPKEKLIAILENWLIRLAK